MREPNVRSLAGLVTLTAVALIVTAHAARESNGEWRTYGGTNANLKYAPLDQITAANVAQLRVAWRQSAMPIEVRRGRGAVNVPTNHQVTPLMAGGLLYASAGDGSVVALHPATGAVQWAYIPDELKQRKPGREQEADTEVVGGRSANRGVAYWTDGSDARVIAIAGRSLVALDARRGTLITTFGRDGRVDLTEGYRRPARSFQWTSVPLVVNDRIVVGGVGRSADG